jgi:hypothetical protein
MLRVMVVGYATTSDCDAILSILHDGGRCRAGVCTAGPAIAPDRQHASAASSASARFIGIPVKWTFDLPDVLDDGTCFYFGDQRANVWIRVQRDLTWH